MNELRIHNKIYEKIFVTIFALLMLLSFCVSNIAEARTIRVKGYYKPSTGRYVMPRYRNRILILIVHNMF